MAIIDSIALGKSKGSIGNVTFYQLNGQTVARYRNTSPRDPKTPAQLAQRQGISNTTSAFSLMKEWAKGLIAIKVGKQTYYNRFTSIMITQFSRLSYATPLDVIKGTVGVGAGVGNSIYLLRPELVGSLIKIVIDKNNQAYKAGWVVNFGLIDESENAFNSISKSLTLTDWNNGFIEFDVIGSLNYKTFAYAYNLAEKKLSDISIIPIEQPSAGAGIANLVFTANGVIYEPIPTFVYTQSGFYDIYIPNTEFTVTFDWVNPLDEHYVMYQDNDLEIVDPNSYTLPNDRPMSEFVIAIYPLLTEEIQYVIRVHKI